MTNRSPLDPAPTASGPSSPRPDDVVVEARGLGVSYAGHEAVRGLDLTVRRGELFALLGTNGAGKTTTLEVLEGHRRATRGTVRVLGGDPTDRRAVRSRVGIMLQDSGLAPELTVRESVRLAGALSGRADDADRLVGLVGLAARSRTRVAQLSGGERRRVDFAMAVWGTPELVFLDEPTTGLDPSARDDLWAAVGALRADGVTFLLTTHYLEEAEQHADRIALMHDGSIRREGTVAELSGGQGASIAFVPPVPLDELPLPVARTENDLVVVETDDVQGDAGLLLRWAGERGLVLERFATRTRGLDDVFRELSHGTSQG